MDASCREEAERERKREEIRQRIAAAKAAAAAELELVSRTASHRIEDDGDGYYAASIPFPTIEAGMLVF